MDEYNRTQEMERIFGLGYDFEAGLAEDVLDYVERYGPNIFVNDVINNVADKNLEIYRGSKEELCDIIELTVIETLFAEEQLEINREGIASLGSKYDVISE